jgi:trans-aconitate methyltransferase
MSWDDYYKNKINGKYLAYAKRRYAPFIKEICSLDSSSFREEGCGIATISRAILDTKPDSIIHLSDIKEEMISLSKKHVNGYNINSFQTVDIRDNVGIDKVGCIFSHGVLEHFSDEDILKILNRQKNSADTVVYYVPTNKYSKGSFGDERLLAPERWERLTKPEKMFLFNDGYDLCLIYKKDAK